MAKREYSSLCKRIPALSLYDVLEKYASGRGLGNIFLFLWGILEDSEAFSDVTVQDHGRIDPLGIEEEGKAKKTIPNNDKSLIMEMKEVGKKAKRESTVV